MKKVEKKIFFFGFTFGLSQKEQEFKASPNSRQDGVRYAKKFKVPRSAVLQIFLRFAHWSCYRELAKADPVLSGLLQAMRFCI